MDDRRRARGVIVGLLLIGLLAPIIGVPRAYAGFFLNQLIVEIDPPKFGASAEQIVRDLVCNPANSIYATRFGDPTNADFLITLNRLTPGPGQGPDDPSVRLLNMIVLDYPDDATTATMLSRLDDDPGLRTISRNSVGDFSTPPPGSSGVMDAGPRFSWVVEYYNPARDHYFLTQSRTEFHMLDVGCFPGWIRMDSFGFNAKVASAAPLLGYLPVCRYYGRPQAGLDSHFFSASAKECQAVAQRFPNAWILESSDAFEVTLPDLVSGACPPATVPVYRLYNNRADVNHRYVTYPGVRNAMMQHGWVPEGYGPEWVAFCAAVQYAQ